MYNNLVRFLSAGFGLGYMPVAPGTFGTLLGCALFYVFKDQSRFWFIQFTVIMSLVSILIAHLGEISFKKKDCQKIVIDEVAGVLVTYAFVGFSIYNLVLGFLFFRLFDVAKIWPADLAQKKLPGGLGVVMDDIVAGLQGGLLLLALPTLIQWVKKGLALVS